MTGGGGASAAAYLKILTPFMFVLPGIIAAALYPAGGWEKEEKRLKEIVRVRGG